MDRLLGATAPSTPPHQGGRPVHMHSSQDNQAGLEVPPRTIEPRNRRDLAVRDWDYRQHGPFQQLVPTQPQQASYSRGTVQAGPEQTPPLRRPSYSLTPAYSYPSQSATALNDRELERRSQWLDRAEGDTGDPSLDPSHSQHHLQSSWRRSPPSPPVDPKTSHFQRRHPYRAMPFTADHRREYPHLHPRHPSPQEQRPTPQEQTQPNLRQQQPHQTQHHVQHRHYDSSLSRERMASQGHWDEELELGRQQRQQTIYNREVMSSRHDPHGMHHQAIHSGHGVSLPLPLDGYGHHHRQHHPPSPYHPYSARSLNRPFSPQDPFASDSTYRPRSPNGGKGTSPPPEMTRNARVDRHSPLPNMEPGTGYPPHTGGSHPRPYFRVTDEFPGSRLVTPQDPRGRPYYSDAPLHDPRSGAPPHWISHPLLDPRLYYRRGYYYGHEHIYETPRGRQATFGMALHGPAVWEQEEDGYHSPLHHRAPWTDSSPPPSLIRRHSISTLGAAPIPDLETQRSHTLEQGRKDGIEGVSNNQSKIEDTEMEDRVETNGSKPTSAQSSRPPLGVVRPRTPGESSSNSEDSFAKTTQDRVMEDSRRVVPGLIPSPSTSSTASISADGTSSAKPSVTSKMSTTMTRSHQSPNHTYNEPGKGPSLSPSPSLHFPSLSLGPSPSTPPGTLSAASPPSENSGAAGVRRWSNSGSGTNPAGSTTTAAEPITQLGLEGYYSKRDLEELYKSWRSNFEEKEGMRALPPHPPYQQSSNYHQHHHHSPRQHIVLGESEGKEVDFLAGGGKDVAEDRLYPERKKVKWRTVEFEGGQERPQQEGGGGGEGGHRGRETTATAATIKRDLSRRSGDKRARLNPTLEASADTTMGEPRNLNQDISEGEDTANQEQDDDENEDDDEKYLSEDDGGSASAEDSGPTSGRPRGGNKRAAPSTPSTAVPEGQPRRIRVQENKSHQCDKCEKRFSRPSQLLTHSFTHSGEKPHQCPHCKRLFNVASNLKRHIRIHSNSKRRSARNGSVVFRSFAQGTHVTQMVTGTIGGGSGGNSGQGTDLNDPNKRAAVLSPRTTSFDRLRWMNTETPTKGLTATQQQQQIVHIASYRPIKAKTGADVPAAAGQGSSFPPTSLLSSSPTLHAIATSPIIPTTRTSSVSAAPATPTAADTSGAISTTTTMPLSSPSTTTTTDTLTPTATPSSGSGTAGSSVSSSTSASTARTGVSSSLSVPSSSLPKDADFDDLSNTHTPDPQQRVSRTHPRLM